MDGELRLRGSYFNVGKQLGTLKKQSVARLIDHFNNSTLYTAIHDYLDTVEGAAVYDQFKATTTHHCPEYVEELQGLAEGAEVSFDDLFVLNLDPEFVCVLADVPDGSHGVKYASLYSGCTNLILPVSTSEIFLVHTEDVDPETVELGCMLSAEIVGNDGVILERWAEYIIPGIVPGSKMGLIQGGLMYAHNNVYQKGINKYGIPRRFMCRRLLSLTSVEEVRRTLKTEPGIASGYTVIFLERSVTNGGAPHVTCTCMEVAGTVRGTVIAEYQPEAFYHHCNTFQHLAQHECHPEESSVHRSATISQYLNRGLAKTRDQLLQIISDRTDTAFPVFRTGQHPDYLATGATAAFDTLAGTLELYTGPPSTNTPALKLYAYEK